MSAQNAQRSLVAAPPSVSIKRFTLGETLSIEQKLENPSQVDNPQSTFNNFFCGKTLNVNTVENILPKSGCLDQRIPPGFSVRKPAAGYWLLSKESFWE